MRLVEKKVMVFGKEATAELMEFDKQDRKKWKTLFDLWVNLKMGMREYQAREPNMLEGISEVAFCLYSGSHRLIGLKGNGVSSSFDTFNVENNKAEQIKACSVMPDLTSFGPKSVWDDLYFLDFYNNGKLDGTFNVYKIPNDLIFGHKVNALQTFKEQQEEKRRPRFSIYSDIIVAKDIKPLDTDIKVW